MTQYARRIRCVDLVDQQEFAGGRGAELVFRIGKYQPGLAGDLLPAGEQFERGRLHLAPQSRGDEPLASDIAGAQRLVVPAVLGLGRRRDDGCREVGVLSQAIGEVIAVDRPGTVFVLTPERRAGDPGDVSADDHLHWQRLGGVGNEDIRVWDIDEMIGDDIAGSLEPPRAELVEHLTLVRHAGDHPVERREAVGGDEQALAAAVGIRNADLAVSAVAERKIDVDERDAHGHRSLA